MSNLVNLAKKEVYLCPDCGGAVDLYRTTIEYAGAHRTLYVAVKCKLCSETFIKELKALHRGYGPTFLSREKLGPVEASRYTLKRRII